MASLTSCQFESVLVNHVSYHPILLVNISLTGVHSVASLQQLAARQDSLFLLSYFSSLSLFSPFPPHILPPPFSLSSLSSFSYSAF